HILARTWDDHTQRHDLVDAGVRGIEGARDAVEADFTFQGCFQCSVQAFRCSVFGVRCSVFGLRYRSLKVGGWVAVPHTEHRTPNVFVALHSSAASPSRRRLSPARSFSPPVANETRKVPSPAAP